MSWQPAEAPACPDDTRCGAVETALVPRVRDLGDFEVRRVLPAAQRQMVGPFIFFDQMGPTVFRDGQAIDVRPHPHIGLATVTWLIEGEIMHRDSLGSAQVIRPGEVNWMTAGSGIVHSERTPVERRNVGAALYGIQTWLALSKPDEETAPAFVHVGATELPSIEGEGMRLTVVAGGAFGRRAPVPVFSETLYVDGRLDSGAALKLPDEVDERGLYVLGGAVTLAGAEFSAGSMLVFRPKAEVVVRARSDSHVLLLGGATVDGPQRIWWNFVSSSAERIEAAKADWKAGRFPKVPGDDEFIPLPDT